MSTVVLDPGHGGRDPGALGKTTQEKANNLTLALKVGKLLQNHNVVVQYTRTSDKDFCSGTYDETVDLQNRIAIAKQYNPDIFVSLHNNSFNKQATGVETHCWKLGGGDEKLARSIQNRLGIIGFVDRGIKVSNFYVLRLFDRTNTNACLVEYGFIDAEEDAILAKMDTAAVAIANGILEAVGVSYVQTPVSNIVVPVSEDKDIYLSVRVLESKAQQAIVDINKLGFAAKILPLA